MAKKQKANRAAFGSIRQLPSGRWQARYPDEKGVPMKAPSTFETSTAAWDHIYAVKTDRKRGVAGSRDGERLFGSFAARWIKNGGSRGHLAIRTTELYEDLLKRHIDPAFGSMPLSSIKPDMVRDWYTDLGEELAKRAAAPRTSKNNTAPRVATGKTRRAQAYRLLNSIMNTAEHDGAIGRNPCRIKGAGQIKADERPLIEFEQFQALVAAHPADLQPVLWTVFDAHLRLGEAVGLKRGDLDTKRGTLTVSGQVVFSTKQGEVRTPTKTGKGRTVDLTEDTVDVLNAYLNTVPKALPLSPLFVRADGRPLTRAQLQHAWMRAREATGYEQFHFHDIRHAGLTYYAQHGATPKELMARAGQGTLDAQMIYQHASAARGKLLAGAVNESMRAAKEA